MIYPSFFHATDPHKTHLAMSMRTILFLINVLLVNAGFLSSFLVRYGLAIPKRSFPPYENSFVFLTLIYLSALVFFRVYKSRFKSSWDLFKRVFCGLSLGTLLSIALVYVFRSKWGAFPTSVFIISFFINLILIFKLNQLILKSKDRIKKRVAIIGEGDVDDVVTRKAEVERRRVDEIEELIEYPDIDEIVICEKIQDSNALNLLTYLVQKMRIEVVFSPAVYMKLLSERINSGNSIHFLSTFVGTKPDVEEFLIRSLDVFGSALVLLICVPLLTLISLLIKFSSRGPVLYKQRRAGKDGRIFTLYKFRTMIKDAEKLSALAPALKDDPRVTRLGRWLRRTRLDELPQLLNVLRGEMSLVGPRPENLYRVEIHKSLQGLRLAVRPGITGLAQIRSFYDLKPRQKIRYDYLYIQQRSLLLNLYILVKTVPVIFSKKGW
ncbi:MAG TPA: exopolysaccharide biosynthesis polyprenyl glycosylphosphotransferase [Sedimentisphaerales bacterium]|nr:exopolysaccharide biosynthesis polyprenyl glycosylphosphotransferase [Sedimentisphaerales bacterium]